LDKLGNYKLLKHNLLNMNKMIKLLEKDMFIVL